MVLLALVNPAAGNGTAVELVQQAEREIFGPAGLKLETLTTTHLGHARDYLHTLPVAQLRGYGGIVIVSGDGLIAEVLQGLASRTDADFALRIPLGPLPAGSGNGRCCCHIDQPCPHIVRVHGSAGSSRAWRSSLDAGQDTG